MAVELCVGCGQPTRGYEYYGVGLNADGTAYEGKPICRSCHHTPPRALKLHYFHASQLERGLAAANANHRATPGAALAVGKR